MVESIVTASDPVRTYLRGNGYVAPLRSARCSVASCAAISG